MTDDEGDSPVVGVFDEQSMPIDAERWATLAAAVLYDEGVRAPAELSLWFVDEDEIAVLNEEHLGESGPTDVLSFPLDASDDEPFVEGMPLLLGDVFICPAVAARNAAEGRGFEVEVRLPSRA